ncbi:putative N-formylglutamate amidohydrolase [Roseibium hamelinense]|uniref:Putative N-formylglutamate amidohydrolase n=1 Tax=Roseibium hamelinense TaxID=150831 RepID=A0A562T1F6_9HYPH|nr:N-formylglutamate amidohydrolase [Roseibium hamelinense]MTI44520.1 N-formylglutamate amidohydrolase [Roseibium hamelinense]TWI87489.1 putative N-formylglutamate amidohydrolase [Roseibium hamelinense]
MSLDRNTGDECPPVAVLNVDGNSPFVLLCDHASNRLPEPYDQCLGISQTDKMAHIAWDPGALGVSKHLSNLLDAPLVYSTLSRLIIDCNRHQNAADLIPSVSELTKIPGNADVPNTERARRIAMAYAPFHKAAEQVLARREAANKPVAVVSIHTYTPVYKGTARPWQIGLIHAEDKRLAQPALTALRRIPGLQVGDNEPYAPADGVYYTIKRHGQDRGHKCLMIEIRNDEVRTPEQEENWANILAAVLTEALAHEGNRLPAAGGLHA